MHKGALALVLLDLHMPGAVGYSGVAVIHATVPDVPILVISGADPAKAARDAQRFGAVGYLGKDADLAAIETVVAAALTGQLAPLPAPPAETDATAQRIADLTPMQLKVLALVLGGMLNKQIAYELGISEATVKAHMTAILRKLDVGNRTQAALAARALGLNPGEA
jgi:DNA-binding NarL/FixJ family response regulator